MELLLLHRTHLIQRTYLSVQNEAICECRVKAEKIQSGPPPLHCNLDGVGGSHGILDIDPSHVLAIEYLLLHAWQGDSVNSNVAGHFTSALIWIRSN